jgi:hypothetical protein
MSSLQASGGYNDPPFHQLEPLRPTQAGILNRALGRSYENIPERIRTSNLRLRRPTLYPVELREQRRLPAAGFYGIATVSLKE